MRVFYLISSAKHAESMYMCESLVISLAATPSKLCWTNVSLDPLRENACFSGIVQLATGQFVHVRIIHTAPRQGHPHRDQWFARLCSLQILVKHALKTYHSITSFLSSEAKSSTATLEVFNKNCRLNKMFAILLACDQPREKKKTSFGNFLPRLRSKLIILIARCQDIPTTQVKRTIVISALSPHKFKLKKWEETKTVPQCRRLHRF